jgi:hypothetical protein
VRQADDPVSDAEVRRKLDALGKRREKLRKMEEELAEDIVSVLPGVKVSSVPMEEAADRLGLNRTTIYQVYLPRVQPAAPRASAA